MANKTSAKTRNSERKNGKAWGKSHNAPVKVLSAEAQQSKAHKDAERRRKRPPAGGSPLTMPKITWDWLTETMRGMHTRTKRYKTVEDFINLSKSRPNG